MPVVLAGLAAFVNRLEKFDQEISRVLKKEMRSGADEVAKEARKSVTGYPISNWGNWHSAGRDLGYDPSKVKSGFRVSTNRFRRSSATTAFGYDVIQSNPGGNVFEVIGDKSRISGPLGAQFVDAITAARPGRTPRTLLPAYYAGIKRAQARIEAAVENAKRKVGL